MRLDFSKGPLIMGVVNVTPDSFSDGGEFFDPESAIAHGLKLLEDGADILDVGGESTRPGADPVSVEEEQKRVLPVIEGLKDSGAFISVDTRHADTMRAAVEVGANMINDVTALSGEGSLKTAADLGVPVCLMHMQGKPQSMQADPQYQDVVQDIYDYLQARIEECVQAGIPKDQIVADPGIGFGKTLAHNVDILKNLQKYQRLGVSILLGTSRKSFIEKIDKGASADQRIGGSLASALWGYLQGAQVFRVHDVKETRQALKVFDVIHKQL